MTPRQKKIYAIVIISLIAGYAFVHLKPAGFVIPFPGRIDGQERRIKQLKVELKNLETIQRQRAAKRQELAARTASYWPHDGKIPVNQIQQKIERLGQVSGVTLNKVGAPKTVEINDTIMAVDVSVSSTTNIKDLSNFLREIANHAPRLVWSNCIIRPNRTKEPTAVTISGTVRTYLLSESALAYLNKEPENDEIDPGNN